MLFVVCRISGSRRVALLNYLHDKKYFFFMKIILFFREEKYFFYVNNLVMMECWVLVVCDDG